MRVQSEMFHIGTTSCRRARQHNSAVDCTHKLWRHSGMYKSPFVHNYVALSWPVFCDIDPDPVSPAFVSFLPLRQSSHRDAASRERQKKHRYVLSLITGLCP